MHRRGCRRHPALGGGAVGRRSGQVITQWSVLWPEIPRLGAALAGGRLLYPSVTYVTGTWVQDRERRM